MAWWVGAFIKASLVWLVTGVTLGIGMAVVPGLLAYRPVHVHLNLLGFVSMMIFGFGYNVIPRFVGHPLHSDTLAVVHWWLANAGLVLLAGGFALGAGGIGIARSVTGIGGLLSAFGAYAFAYNLWRTIGAGRAAATAHQARSQRSRATLPVMSR